MTMPQMQQAISNLRLLLASVKAKEQELESLAGSSSGSWNARPAMRYRAETHLK